MTMMRRSVLCLFLTVGLLIPSFAQAQLKITNAAASAAADAIVDRVDAGPGAGSLYIFGAACPTNANDADAGTLLAQLTFAATAFGNAVNGVATAASITQDSSADATGTAACFRVKDGSNVVIFQGAVTATGGGGQMQLVTTSIVATQPVQITSMTLTVPLAP